VRWGGRESGKEREAARERKVGSKSSTKREWQEERFNKQIDTGRERRPQRVRG